MYIYIYAYVCYSNHKCKIERISFHYILHHKFDRVQKVKLFLCQQFFIMSHGSVLPSLIKF